MLEERKRRDTRSERERDWNRGRGSVREDEAKGVRELGGKGGVGVGVSGRVWKECKGRDERKGKESEPRREGGRE